VPDDAHLVQHAVGMCLTMRILSRPALGGLVVGLNGVNGAKTNHHLQQFVLHPPTPLGTFFSACVPLHAHARKIYAHM
jgi:hypothetical protein